MRHEPFVKILIWCDNDFLVRGGIFLKDGVLALPVYTMFYGVPKDSFQSSITVDKFIYDKKSHWA